MDVPDSHSYVAAFREDIRLLLVPVPILRWWLLTTVVLLPRKVRHCGGDWRVEVRCGEVREVDCTEKERQTMLYVDRI